MFYIIEKKDQLEKLGPFKDCFIDFIQQNSNFHPKLNPLSLVYIRPLDDHKGYILCLNHSESFSLNQEEVFDWINKNTERLFVFKKKEALYHFPYFNKLYDISFIENVSLDKLPNNTCINWYYRKYEALPNINCLIPLSKIYEEKEHLFELVLPIIQKYNETDLIYSFNNYTMVKAFWGIEKNGIKVDKHCFLDCYGNDLKHPEFSLHKGKIHSQYNLYTTTSRPSNTYNHINFAALNKNNGERLCYRPTNDIFIEFDFQGYHPRLIGELINFDFPTDKTTYEYLGEILGVTAAEAKELTFKQMYGGVWKEYRDKPFFKDIITYINKIWDEYEFDGFYKTKNKTFIQDKDMSSTKLFNYVIQSTETSHNAEMLCQVLNYLKDKQTKLILYTYDAFLFDFAKSDGKEILIKIQQILKYPTNIKTGKTYHNLQKI